MGIFRTYFSKNNTIQRDSYVNTSKNPIVELFYGGSTDGTSGSTTHSRYIFQFDTSNLQSLYSNKVIISGSPVTHKLKMTNTSFFDKELLGQDAVAKSRATSFDLVLFEIPESWDEGVGYDYVPTTYINSGMQTQKNFFQGPSNWIERKTGLNWNELGAVGDNPTIINQQHFDNGDENIEMDITSWVNDILLSGATNNGFGVSFSSTTEQLNTINTYYVGFFSKYTNTFYEPFIETEWDDTINDDRSRFYLDKPNRLYFYTNAGGAPVDASIASVSITDPDGTVFSSYTASQIVEVKKGVFYVNIMIPSSTYEDVEQFTDTWSGIVIDGNTQPSINLYFTTLSRNYFYNLGDQDKNPPDFGLNFYGIKREEKIKRGDVRKVMVEARPYYSVNQTILTDMLQYRLYVKQGLEQIPVIGWTDINKTFSNNHFILDTSWMIPNDYFIDVRVRTDQMTKTYSEIIKFTIISQDDKFNILTFDDDRIG